MTWNLSVFSLDTLSGLPPTINSSRSVSKQNLSGRNSIVSELLPIQQVPRMPTEKEASEVGQ